MPNHELRVTCYEIPEGSKTFGDYKWQQTKGWETDAGINTVLFDAIEKLLNNAPRNRVNLIAYLRDKGL